VAAAAAARGPTPLPGLRAARRRARLTQARLGALSEISTFSIYRAERGDSFSFAFVQKLAAALGVEPRALTDPPTAA
jgi:hypothetical protein